LKAINQTRSRKIAAALAVVLLHVVVIRVLLSVRTLFDFEQRGNTVTTWIILPPIQSTRIPQPPPSVGLPMVPLTGESSNFGPEAITPFIPLSLTQPSPNALTYPDTHVLGSLAEYFSCTLINYDKISDSERERCALRLSNLGDVTRLTGDYADYVGTPFKLFGAEATFLFTPATEPAFNLFDAMAGCSERILCRSPIPPEFGLDPDDKRRTTAVVKFQLAKELTLQIGAQTYMEPYLGGARMVYTSGVVVTYRW